MRQIANSIKTKDPKRGRRIQEEKYENQRKLKEELIPGTMPKYERRKDLKVGGKNIHLLNWKKRGREIVYFKREAKFGRHQRGPLKGKEKTLECSIKT